MTSRQRPCPDCDEAGPGRRDFFRAVGAVALGAPVWASAKAAAAPAQSSAAETAVTALYESFTDEQRKAVCFAWDHEDARFRGLPLRSVVTPNWMVTKHKIRSDFYTQKQQHLIHDAFKGLIHPDWHARYEKEIADDCGGPFGCEHSLAIFGTPGSGKFEAVFTGRHMTLRADGDSVDKAAFGGPIFYGHQGERFNEVATHPGNVFWPQAVAANKVFEILDGTQREAALFTGRRPAENRRKIEHRGPGGTFDGLAVSEMSLDQRAELQKVLAVLVEPFRVEDRAEVTACLKKHGGLDGCHLTFYRDGDIGGDGVWDNWKLEGPRFCWWFRGEPHVHVWVNVAC
jgi:hypothetical protein